MKLAGKRAWAGAWLVPVVLLIAAFAKLYWDARFIVSLESFTLLPASWRGVVVAGLPCVEAIPGGLVIMGAPRAANLAAVWVTSSLSAVMAGHWIMGARPRCECFGRLGAALGVHQSPSGIFAINVVLLAVALFMFFRLSKAHAAKRLHDC